MKKVRKVFKTHEIAEIAMIVAAMISGGYVIYITIGQLPLPGIKYLVMAPYFAAVMALLVVLSSKSYRIFWVNAVFSGIMLIINVYMGLSIFCVGVLCTLVEYFFKSATWRPQILGISYATFTVGVSLFFSKYIIGNALFQMVTPIYILVLMTIAFLLGLVGSMMGVFVAKKVKGGLLG